MLVRPGDWLLALLGLVLIAVLATQTAGQPDRVLIKQAGQPFMDTNLRLNRIVSVPGPLGDTEVEILDGQVRVKSDPSPRQLCVKQGWLQAGQAAICLPNRVSVELGRAAYDSLNY